MFKRMLALAFMGYAAWRWDTHRRDRSRLDSSSKAKPKDVTTWEGEGGALPITGSQTGPMPELPADAAAR